MFADDILAPTFCVGQESPARFFQQLVDGDAGLGFRGQEIPKMSCSIYGFMSALMRHGD
jgi:hypothetical protein